MSDTADRADRTDEEEREKQLLEVHRRTLAHYLKQQAQLGLFTPPYIAISIAQEREAIRQIENLLRGLDVPVDDMLADDSTDIRITPPPHIANSIADAYEKIRQIEELLRNEGTFTDDMLADDSTDIRITTPSLTSKRITIEVVFQGDLASLTPELRVAAIDALASKLGISPQQIQLLGVLEGSIIFKLKIPEDAANKLLSLYEEGNPIILDVGGYQMVIDEVRHSSNSSYKQNGKPVQIFLCHAGQDEQLVTDLYIKLKSEGFNPWMAKEDILPGEKWKSSIKRAIQQSSFFLACLSRNAVNKRGFLQKEIQDALEIWKEKLEDDIYLIPVRLESCIVPDNLYDFQWVDLFAANGFPQLVRSVHVGVSRLEYKP